MKECPKVSISLLPGRDLAIQPKIRAAEEDCSEKEIVSASLNDYLKGEQQSMKKRQRSEKE